MDGRACNAGHVFCRVCIHAWLQEHSICPIGREPLKAQGLSVPLLYKELTDELEIACSNAEVPEAHPIGIAKGCAWKKTFGELEAHLKECKFKMEPCGMCAAMVLASSMREHEEQCPERKHRCEYCAAEMKVKDLPTHQEQKCPKSPLAIVECMCGSRMTRNQQEEHVSQQMAKHWLLQSQKLTVVEHTLNSVRSATFMLEIEADVSLGADAYRSPSFAFG